MKKHYIELTYNFFGRDFDYGVDDHTQYAIQFLKDEYGLEDKHLDKLIIDFDLIYLLGDNQQYLGILHKVFYEDALKEYKKEIEEDGE